MKLEKGMTLLFIIGPSFRNRKIGVDLTSVLLSYSDELKLSKTYLKRLIKQGGITIGVNSR